MKIAVLGAGGQLGTALCASDVGSGFDRIPWDLPEVDLTCADSFARRFEQDSPDLVINASAYTAVDQAETDAALAFGVNRDGVDLLGRVAAARAVPVFHVSTDYVFDGNSDRPYREDDPTAPLGVYGQSKWEGEERLRAAQPQHLIVRVSWLFGQHGANFVRTMLRLGSERRELSIVADQFGGPTPAEALADRLLESARRFGEEGVLPWGTYHYSGRPVVSWHGFAEEIFERARKSVPLAVEVVRAIPSSEYPTPAPRPLYSVLDGDKAQKVLGWECPDWRTALNELLDRELA